MKCNRVESDNPDVAVQVRRRMEGKGKRRFAKQLLERSARWRREGNNRCGFAAVIRAIIRARHAIRGRARRNDQTRTR